MYAEVVKVAGSVIKALKLFALNIKRAVQYHVSLLTAPAPCACAS
jgi:hypothetical protein